MLNPNISNNKIIHLILFTCISPPTNSCFALNALLRYSIISIHHNLHALHQAGAYFVIILPSIFQIKNIMLISNQIFLQITYRTTVLKASIFCIFNLFTYVDSIMTNLCHLFFSQQALEYIFNCIAVLHR